MFQWFIRFPEFAEFSESSPLFRKNSIVFNIDNVGIKGYKIPAEKRHLQWGRTSNALPAAWASGS